MVREVKESIEVWQGGFLKLSIFNGHGQDQGDSSKGYSACTGC